MRAALLTLLVAVAFAGCLTTDDDEGGATAPLPPLFAAVCPAAAWASAWADPCTMLSSPNDSPSKAEIDLRINPTDPDNVVVASKDLDRSASDCVWAVAQVTKDGGQTWTTVYVGGDRAGRHPLLEPFSCVTDPIMAFDGEGVAYYALQAYRVGLPPLQLPTGGTIPVLGSTFILARSTNGGLTWDHFALQHAGDGTAVFHDYPRMMVNPATGSIHTIWNGVGSAPGAGGVSAPADPGVSPWVSTSRDGGESVEAPVTFWKEGAERDTSFASGFAASSDGTIYVTAWTAYGEARTFELFRSTDDARSFEYVGPGLEVNYPPRQREQNLFRTPGFVEMAIDGSGGPFDGRMHVFWTDHPRAGERAGQSDILAAWSDDGGATWSAPVRVNDDDSMNDQFFPRGVVDEDGNVHLLFDDRRHDAENRLIDMYYAYSTDGGATWTNRRLTAASFDGDLGIHQNGFPFIGDYNGIGVQGGDVFFAWGDTSTGVAEVAFARASLDG